MQLLFCDTFSQDPADGTVNSSWSIIEFPTAVVLEEIHVVPRGVRLHDQLNGEGQCGKTSPGQFRIDFFACDVKNEEGASTFENLCALEYLEGSRTTALPRLPFATNKLLCSGWYTSVTLAVFGADASDSAAVRSIHKRRENETRSLPLVLLPQEIYPNIDDRQVTGPFGTKLPFPTPVLPNPQPEIVVSAAGANFHGYGQEKDNTMLGFGVTEPVNYANTYDNRPYRDRTNDGFQFTGERTGDEYYKKTPLLPTPTLGENDQTLRRRPNRYGLYGRYPHNEQHYQNQSSLKWDSDSYQRGDSYLGMDQGQRRGGRFVQNDVMEQKHQIGQEEDDWDDAEYEEISDEEIMDDDVTANMEAMVAENLLLPSSMMSFNPFHMEMYPLTSYKSPDLSAYEVLRGKLQVQQENEMDEHEGADVEPGTITCDQSQKLKKLINKTLKLCPVPNEIKGVPLDDAELGSVILGKEQEWVSNLEEMTSLLHPGLAYLELEADHDYSCILSVWTCLALSLDNQDVAKVLGLNVRALKAGLSLALSLCQMAGDVCEQLVKVHLVDRLIDILDTKHTASALKVRAIHVFDALTNWPSHMHTFLLGDIEFTNRSRREKRTGYSYIVSLALERHPVRVATAITQLIRKAHLYECMNEIRELTQVIVTEKMPDEYAYVSDEDNNDDDDYNHEEDVEMVVMSSASGDEEEETAEESTMTGQTIPEERIFQNKEKKKIIPLDPNVGLNDLDSGTEQNIPFVENTVNTSDVVAVPLESVFSMDEVTVDEEDLLKIADCLDEITVAFHDPYNTIAQFPVTALPVLKGLRFAEVTTNRTMAMESLCRMSEGAGLLLSVQALLTLPVVSGHKRLFQSCCNFLEELMSQKNGILHLFSNSDSMLHCIQHLLKSSLVLDVETPGTAGHLGVKLAFHIQIVQSIDHICSLLESYAEEDDVEEELSHAFKALFSFMYPSFGKCYVSRVFAMDDHLKPIFSSLWYPHKLSDPDPIAEPDKKEDSKQSSDVEKNGSSSEGGEAKEESKPEPIQHRSAVNSYAACILHLLLERSNDVSFIYKYLPDLARSCLSKLHVTIKSDGLKFFLKPLEKELTGDLSDVTKLVNLIKEESALLELSTMASIGPGICTALRLISHLCLQDVKSGTIPDFQATRLIMELFSADALNVIILLANQLHKAVHYYCHGIRPMAIGLSASTHSLITSMTNNIFTLLNHMLHKLLDSSIESKNVNGTQIAQAVVALYSDIFILLQPVDPVMLQNVTAKAASVISLFFSSGCSCFDQVSSIISEIIQFAESQCDKFVPSLTLFAELLPMPLPIVSPSEPPDNARAAAVSSCKLWSSCITPHLDKLTSLLLPLSSSTCRPVIKILVVVMQQLIDLSPSLAASLCNKYIDEISPLLVSTVIGNEGEVEVVTEDDTAEKELMLSPEQITMIQTFSEILTLPAAKSAVICQMVNEGDGMMDLWTYASNSETPKEDVAAILLLTSVLVDAEFSLLPITHDLQSLANCLPPIEHIKAIVTFASSQVTNPSCLVVGCAMLVLGSLLKTRFGAYHVHNALLECESRFFESCKQVCDKFDSTQKQSLDACYNLIELLHMLNEPVFERIHDDHTIAKYCMSKSEVKLLLNWEKDHKQHPLVLLEDKLAKVYSSDDDMPDDVIDHMLDRLASFRQSLSATTDDVKVDAVKEEELPKPMSVAEQFAERPVFTSGCKDSMLDTRISLTNIFASTSYSSPGDEEQRVVQCDLIATAEKFCPGYDLVEQIKNLAKSGNLAEGEESAEALAKRRQKMETYSARLGKTLTFMKRSHGLLFSQQKNGRGRGRGRGNPGNRPFDVFRHRKQNTSRPPSMHVDDFVAADEEQMKIDGEPSFFKPPLIPPQNQVTRRPQVQSFKQREFVPRGRGGRGARTGYRPRGNFTYQANGANNSPLNRFRPKTNTGGRGGIRHQDRFRGTTRITSRLSFSPREGFKTNKQDQGNWSGGFYRDYSGNPSFRGRGSKVSKGRGNYSFNSSGNKQWVSSFQRRARGYNKPRGKHIRSFTR